MTTSASLVSLFKEQLENESASIALNRGLQKRGDFLTWWYFTRLMQLKPAQVEEIVCDGPNDLGIDAIWIDEDSVVHFYQFKNPEDLNSSFPGGDVDKILAGLNLILSRAHDKVANASLKDRIEEIYQVVASGYRLHLVTSGSGISAESQAKLVAFVDQLKGPSEAFFTWSVEDISRLQDAFYQKSLPTVEAAVELQLDQAPYPVRSADHECYLFHTTGTSLAELYDKYGEQLLQQNIRVYQGDSATNAVIRKSCTSDESGNFLHYNNGVAFLAETAQWDAFARKLTIRRFQVVNGGQTIRVLHRSLAAKELRNDVLVPVRVITSQGDKEFGSNVTVNLNNQNRIEPSFLRSNDPRIIQLGNALASLGWYLERREGEISALTATERQAVETRIGCLLDGHVIHLKDGMQAYVATFMRQPELAKKNPKKIFLGSQDGGIFELVFGADLSAEKVVTAHRLASAVSEYVKQFMTRKRRKERAEEWTVDYEGVLGKQIVEKHGDVIDQVVPQSAMFLSAIVFAEWVNIRKQPLEELLAILEKRDYAILNEKLDMLIDFVKRDLKLTKSWPTLLKSQGLFDNFVSFLQGKWSNLYKSYKMECSAT